MAEFKGLKDMTDYCFDKAETILKSDYRVKTIEIFFDDNDGGCTPHICIEKLGVPTKKDENE